MSSRRESAATVHEETVRRFSIVPKLVHYASKFALNDDERQSTLQTPSRFPPSLRNDRRRSTLEISDRFV
jgi:hypothetical protein